MLSTDLAVPCSSLPEAIEDNLRFYVLFNSISVISGRRTGDNERLCAMERRLRLKRFPQTVFHYIQLTLSPTHRPHMTEILLKKT